MKSSTNVASFIMPNQFYWQFESNAIRFGTNDIFPDGKFSSYYTNSYQTIFDTGTSGIFVPKSN